MNARVSLLVLVVFTFMAIWDADRLGKATKPVHAPQPMNWNLPLPSPGDELATMATPILPSRAEVEVAVQELSAGTEPAIHLKETHEIQNSTKTESLTVDLQPAASIDQADAATEARFIIADTQVEAFTTPGTETTAPHSEPTEVSEPADSAAAEVDPSMDSPTTEEQSQTTPVASDIPESLQLPDSAMNQRILELSRSALAVHEQSRRPIHPELTPEASESAAAEPTSAVETSAVGESKTVDQMVPERSEEETVDYLPVPRSLASGTWQVISQDGEMLEITISRSEQQASEQSLKNKYAVGVNSNGKRWAFIRLEKPAVAESSTNETQQQEGASESERPVQKAATEFFSPTAR